MKIGILGSGNVGQTLANGFLKHGYDVMIGTEHLGKINEWKEKSKYSGKVGSFDQTASFGDIVLISVKGTVAKDVVKMVKEQLSGKTVIDTTNPIADSPPKDGILKYFTSLDVSLMEQLQKIVPDANFVKAFNSVGASLMVNPDFESKPTMFICGNNKDAKKEVAEILDKFGFEAEDMGKAEAARAIEPLCILWCIPGFLRNDWSHAFKLLKK